MKRLLILPLWLLVSFSAHTQINGWFWLEAVPDSSAFCMDNLFIHGDSLRGPFEVIVDIIGANNGLIYSLHITQGTSNGIPVPGLPVVFNSLINPVDQYTVTTSTNSIDLCTGDTLVWLNSWAFTNNDTCGSFNTLKGQVFNDLNQDGLHDPGEPGLEGWPVRLQPGNRLTYTTRQGYYHFYVDKGSYLVTPLNPLGLLSTGATVYLPKTSSTGNLLDHLDFSFTDTVKIHDLCIDACGLFLNGQVAYQIKYINAGTSPEQAEIRFVHPPGAQPHLIYPHPDSAYGDTLIWLRPELLPDSAAHYITLIYNSLPPGTSPQATASISPVTGGPPCNTVTIMPTGLPERAESLWQLYPNPADQWVRIGTGTDFYPDRVLLYSASGTLLRETGSGLIDLSGLANGLYVLRVYTSSGIFTRKLLVIHR